VHGTVDDNALDDGSLWGSYFEDCCGRSCQTPGNNYYCLEYQAKCFKISLLFSIVTVVLHSFTLHENWRTTNWPVYNNT
jgi:hypothetical protein